MAKHEIKLKIHTGSIGNKDMELEVRSDGGKLGDLLVSKGSIEWKKANASKTKFAVSWEEFADFMEQNGRKKK